MLHAFVRCTRYKGLNVSINFRHLISIQFNYIFQSQRRETRKKKDQGGGEKKKEWGEDRKSRRERQKGRESRKGIGERGETACMRKSGKTKLKVCIKNFITTSGDTFFLIIMITINLFKSLLLAQLLVGWEKAEFFSKEKKSQGVKQSSDSRRRL